MEHHVLFSLQNNEKIFMNTVSDRILLIKLIVGQRVVTLLSVYAPQSGLSDVDKDLFFDQLRAVTARIPRSELLIPCGDWNGHVGRAGTEYREVHGGMGYGRSEPDVQGERILEYALAFDLLLGNTCFKKRDSHLITYKSGNAATQIDFILFPRAMRKLVTDVKVIPGEEVALQRQLLVCDMKFDVPPKPKRKFTPRLKVWKLTDPQRRNHFQEVFKLHVSAFAGVPDAATEDIWNNLKTGLLKTTEEVCGTTRPHRWRRETWWWNEHVGEVITALRKLGVDEWIVHLVQGMYANARSRVRVGEGYSEEFEVKVGVHQGSVLSPLLFIIVLEALSCEFRCGVPWEDLYADDLVIIAESLEECVRRLLTWKEAMEEKGLRVNAGKTKIMICGMGLDLLQSSGEFPCAVCRTGVGSNSIFCKGCKHWVHKKCSGLKRLTEDPDYRCTRCKGTACPLDGRPQREAQVGPDKLEVVASF